VQVLRADSERQIRAFDQQRALNHHLAGLTAYAYHSPKKMPRYKPTSEAAKAKAGPEPVNTEWARAQVSAFFTSFKVNAQAKKKRKG